MNAKQKKNAFLVLDALEKSSIKSDALRIGILCVLMKESGFIPRVESSYANTSNERIRKIFGKKKLGGLYYDDVKLNHMKNNPEMFFSWVYRGVAGNGPYLSGDGHTYRGRGFNQITGLSNYALMQKLTGYALVDRPGMLRYPECAAKCAVAFFEHSLDKARGKYVVDISECIIERERQLFAAAWINAGIGKKPQSAAVQRACKNALKFLPAMTEIYGEWKNGK